MKKIRALEPQLLVLEALTYNQWVITMGQMLQATYFFHFRLILNICIEVVLVKNSLGIL